MPVDIRQFQIGEADIYIGGTAPVTGDELVIDANGVPQNGSVHVGATTGPATLKYDPEDFEPDVEQANGPIVAFRTKTETTLEFTALQIKLDKIANVILGTVTDHPGEDPKFRDLKWGGDICHTYKTVVLVAKRPCQDVYISVVLYKAYPSEGLELNLQKAETSEVKMVFKAVEDLTRPRGDRVGQIIRQREDDET